MKKIIAVMLSMLIFTGCNNADSTDKVEKTYANTLFDTSYVHNINITISDEDWQDLIANPAEKTKYSTNIEIDGETVKNVSFATKGNSSLQRVSSSDGDRYSFKVNFGKYVDNQTYYGLDKLNLNNIISDATYMKDYISYYMMAEAGVASPLASYVSLSINGELFGLYIAIEDIDDSFIERNSYNNQTQLYKPESSGLDALDDKNVQLPDGMQLPENGELPQLPDGMQLPENGELPQLPDGMQMPENGELPQRPDGMQMPEDGELPQLPDGMQMPEDGELPQRPDGMQMPPDNIGGGGMMHGGMSGQSANGADLAYTDDNVDSYSDIFDNAITKPSDKNKDDIIKALKNLSEGTDIESCIDVDEVINYFVAHNFVLNYDSYTGTMLHNYVLCQTEGKLSMLPWDYNEGFGGFNSQSDATSLVNWPIDSPLVGTTEDARPMWSFITENEEYLNKYHNAYSQFISDVFESGKCQDEIVRIYQMIRPYVEKDPSAFFSVDEFDTAVDTLKSFVKLRSESIRGQLDGSIPSTSDGQKTNSSALIDAGNININAMGSQSGNKNMGNGNKDNMQGMNGNNNGQRPEMNNDNQQSEEGRKDKKQ